jgi:hypothetical protein
VKFVVAGSFSNAGAAIDPLVQENPYKDVLAVIVPFVLVTSSTLFLPSTQNAKLLA